MASLVGMCNAALIKVGGNEILSLTEETDEARLCNSRHQEVMDSLLQSHPWNFAVARATLTPLTTSPNHEWDYQFLLPTNPYCLKVLDVYNDYDHKIEGRYLLCNESSVSIAYIKRISDVNDLSPMFRELFSLKLAAEICYSIAGSNALKQEILGEFDRTIKAARSVDAQEGTPDQWRDGSWYTSRGLKSSRYVVARRY